MTDQPAPQRIGDAERDEAAGYLRDHLAAGRISAEEFDERIGTVLEARYGTDLGPAFADLPEPRPASPGTRRPAVPATPTSPSPPVTPPAALAHRIHPAPPARTAGDRALDLAVAAAWPLVIVFCFATTWSNWWLIFIPVILSSIAGKRRQQRQDPSGPQPS